MSAFLHGGEGSLIALLLFLVIVLIVLGLAYGYYRTVGKGGKKRSSSNKKRVDGE